MQSLFLFLISSVSLPFLKFLLLTFSQLLLLTEINTATRNASCLPCVHLLPLADTCAQSLEPGMLITKDIFSFSLIQFNQTSFDLPQSQAKPPAFFPVTPSLRPSLDPPQSLTPTFKKKKKSNFKVRDREKRSDEARDRN